MLRTFTNQLWDELIMLLNKEDVQQKLRKSIIMPVIRKLIDEMFNYIVVISVLFLIIIILLIVVIYNQTKIIR